jgi:VCBS repeat-containing protein
MRAQTTASAAIASMAVLLVGAAHASGQAPVAVADSATVTRGGQVTVLNGGGTSVLANDTDHERDALTAQLTRQPARGTLTLRADGTFIYKHDGSSNSSDEFRYRAFDGSRTSSEVKVTIAVTAAAVAPRIVGQRALSTPEDTRLTITLQDLTVQDSDSAYPGAFSLILRDGDNFSLQGTSVVPDADFYGTLSVPTRVNDGQADSNEFLLNITVQPVNDSPVVKQAPADQLATEGELFRFDFAPLFGDVDTGDSLTFVASGLPPSGSLKLSTAGVLSGTPLAIDAQVLLYRVAVTSRDRAGASAGVQLSLTVRTRRADLSVRITADPDPATVAAAPQWSIETINSSSSASDATVLTADLRSTGGPVTLTTASDCTILDNGTARVRLQCRIAALAAGAAAVVRIQSTQAATGDQAVRARVDLADANPGNNEAFKSLNVAGTFGQDPAQRLLGAGADLAVGDLDADRRPDLVAVGDRVRVFFNTGAKTFDPTPVSPPGASTGDVVALLDWNRDTRVDIAVLRNDGAAGRVFAGDGARGFAAGTALPPISARAVAVVDSNLDGTNEIAVTGAAGTALLAPGANPTIIDARAGRALAAGDFNGDGRVDLAAALDSGGVAMLESTGSGSFTVRTLPGLGVVVAIAAGGVSGDDAADLLLAIDSGSADAPENAVLRNERNGTFSSMLRFGATKTAQLLVADVNADRLADVVALNATGVHQVYFGDRTSGLLLQPEFLLDPGTATAELADLDADGVPDLFVAGAAAPNVVVLRNSGIGRFGLGDVSPPLLKLVGDASVSIKATSAYVDPGATAIDEVSGDLTPSIVVKNPVNTAIIGAYRVSYDVTDRAGNSAATVFRTVNVEAATEGGGGGGSAGLYELALLAGLLLWALAASHRAKA